MARVRRMVFACVLAGCVAAVGAGAASAETFYVEERLGSDTFPCTKSEPCETIARAIKRSESFVGPNTIEVSPEGPKNGVFEESLELAKAQDAGLTINGEEAGVEIVGKGAPALKTKAAPGSITVSNLGLREASGSTAAIADEGARLTLDEALVENESGENGVEVRQLGSLTMNGGRVLMENGASGFAIEGFEGALALNGVTIVNGGESQAEAGGVNSERSTLAMTNTNVAIESGLGPVLFGVATGSDTAVSLSNVSVKQGTAGAGVVFEKSPTTVAGLQLEMRDAGSVAPGVLDESETPGISSTLSQVTVSGAWKGPSLVGEGEQIALSDSHLAQASSSAQPALRYGGGEAGTGLVVRRSVLQAPAAAKPAVAEIADSNATIDSSEVIGGAAGVVSESSLGGVHTLTVAASTIAPNPGISLEAPGVVGIETSASGNKSSTVQATIEGSIVLESQIAKTANAGNTSKVTCGYSAIPSQIQSVNAIAGHGEIACASGVGGNTNASTESATLFAEPLHNYTLSPTSSAIDSVPASAISLPFGLTPSATDVAGKPRVIDGNGDCVAVQDKGALELQGHAAACPTPSSTPAATPTPGGSTKLVPPPLARPAITALTIGPSAFFAAPFGPAISKPSKKRYGAKIGWRDSVAATTTFTVVQPSTGRRQGKSCAKPSKRNRRGKRCTLLSRIGSFTHVDVAGANSLLFSGRIRGKLRPGSYVLQAVARNAAGAGAIVSRPFKIK